MTDWTARAREIAQIETAAVQLQCTEKLLDFLTRDDEASLAYSALMEIIRSQMAQALAAVAVEAYQEGLDDDGRIHESCDLHGIQRFDGGDGSELSAAVRARLLWDKGHAAGVAEELARTIDYLRCVPCPPFCSPSSNLHVRDCIQSVIIEPGFLRAGRGK